MFWKQRTTAMSAVFLASVLAISACGLSGASTTDESNGSATTVSVEADSNAATGDGSVGSIETTATATENQESHFDDNDLDYDEPQVVDITLADSGSSTSSDDVTVDGSVVSVTAAGTYRLTGTLTDGQVSVEVGDEEDVIIILDGVDITNIDGSALAVINGDDAVILLADGSTNRLTDGVAYIFPEAETDEPNATLYSAADLTIAGSGELVVTGNYNDGIGGKDGLVIVSGTITVTAVDDGIRGKDYIIIEGGTVTVDAGGDGFKADNEDDADRGYVQIDDGAIVIDAGEDGVQAATDIIVNGGVLTLAAGDDGIHGDLFVTINDGTVTITEAFEGIESEVITVNGGTIDISSSDDGLNVASSEESTETDAAPEVGAGQAGEPPAAGGAGGPAGVETVGDYYIYINGGTISITILEDLAEQGDGIDANGHVVMTGGVVTVSGPTDTRNSAIDYSGGTFTMTGGLFIGTNIDGRNSEGVGVGSSQPSMYLSTGSTIAAGTVVEVSSTDGDSLVTFEPVNDYSVIVFSSPDLVDGGTYDIYLGGELAGSATAGLAG